MKRQIFALFMALVLATATGLLAQSGGGSGGGANSGSVSQTPNPNVAPSQQVDQSNQPEHAGRPDVDVDTGKNANNGVLNMDVKRHGDSDTKAGNNPNGNRMDTTTTGSYNSSYGNDTTGTSAGSSRRMPRTASDMPLVGLLGALSLAGALGLRSLR